ncbi:MAG: hypothetical protein QM754_20735 [Tepidisphaeraceae bacterium]
MKRFLIAAVASASLMAFGCDDKNEQKAATPELDKAADKTAAEGKDQLSGVKKTVEGGVEQAKDEAAKQGAAAKDAAAASGDAIQKQADELISKAKTAVEEKKFADAQGYVDQLKTLKGKLPADAQKKVDDQLAEVDKLIAAGKQLMGGAPGVMGNK